MPVPPKTAEGGSPSPGTTSACVRVTSPGMQCWELPQAQTEPGLRGDMFPTSSGYLKSPTDPRPSVLAGLVPRPASPSQQHGMGKGSRAQWGMRVSLSPV